MNTIPKYTSHPDIPPSHGELKVMAHLDKFQIIYFREVHFKGCNSANGRPFRYDFYLPDYRMLIEYDGKEWHKTESQKVRDEIKNSFAKKRGLRIIRLQGFDKIELLFTPTNLAPITNKVVKVSTINEHISRGLKVSKPKQPKAIKEKSSKPHAAHVEAVKQKQFLLDERKKRQDWKPKPLQRRAIL